MGKRLLQSIDFQLLLESVPGLYLILLPGDDFKIAFASDDYLSAINLKHTDIAGRSVFDIFPGKPDDRQATGILSLKHSLNNVIKNKVADTMVVQKNVIRKPDGRIEEGFWKMRNKPVLNSKKEIEYIIHYAENVTGVETIKKEKEDLRKLNNDLEKKITERTSQLQAVNKELESFSYSVSHDLRAPLRAVDGYSKIIVDDYADSLNDEGKRLLGVVQYNAQKMGALIDDLLAFSRLGKKELQKTAIDMGELTEGAIIELGKTMVHTAEIKFKTLNTIRADYSLMNQVMINLISNAIKYSSKKEKPVVEILSSKKNNEIIFTVKDNGVGFDMKYAHKLFGVFQRLHTIEEFDGTGVGLAIVHRIISKHGGRIWAEAKEEEGASFYFALPEE